MADMTIKEIEELVADIGQGADMGVYDPSTGGWVGSMLDAERADDLLQNAYVALRQLLNAQKWREIETAPKDGSEIWILYPYPILEQKARWVNEGPIKNMWVGSRPTWDHDEAGGKLVLLPEDEWDRQTFPSSEPTHWLPIVPLPSPPQEKENGDV